ncbi:uncharacterized protein TNCV_3506551 [Trichonephila clavipes]|uniref:Mutator-like transposase domain-containing protein n=1 Tax=Trichonephila clavipes TaxID=2585209 RepID=A0A8X6S1C5_TRICX|nr:uncharacterized protein TNCV_3506551 [Trichonephila clavipes]
MPRTKRKNKSSKLIIQKRWCTKTKTENNMDISEHNSNVAQLSSDDSIFKNERVSMQEKSVLEQENVDDTYDGPSYIIVDKNALCDVFKYTFCGSCNQSTLKLEFGHKYGFSHQLKLLCKTCSEQKMECFTSPRLLKKIKYFYTFRCECSCCSSISCNQWGHASVEKCCMFLNMPLMSSKTFNEIKCYINSAYSLASQTVLNYVHNSVQNAYRKLDQNGSNTVTDIAVSFDGTWLTRGHTSQIGIGCVVDTLTGYVIDYEIMSKYCPTCISAKNELGETTAEYDVWYSGHKNSCQINHVGTSGAMEMKAAAKIWSRSEACCFRYTTLLSDGETHKFLNSLKIYGADVEILKEECIKHTHVGKRLGTSLRNLVKDWRAKGIPLGGKSYGSLKETTIKKTNEVLSESYSGK